MAAGLNRVCELTTFLVSERRFGWRRSTQWYSRLSELNIRIEQVKPTQVLLEQGVQVVHLYNAMLHPGNIVVKENDQIRFTAPVNDRYYNQKFRVVGVLPSSGHPAHDRNLMRYVLKRFEESHANNLQ
jgi:hypothetical protein